MTDLGADHIRSNSAQLIFHFFSENVLVFAPRNSSVPAGRFFLNTFLGLLVSQFCELYFLRHLNVFYYLEHLFYKAYLCLGQQQTLSIDMDVE